MTIVVVSTCIAVTARPSGLVSGVADPFFFLDKMTASCGLVCFDVFDDDAAAASTT